MQQNAVAPASLDFHVMRELLSDRIALKAVSNMLVDLENRIKRLQPLALLAAAYEADPLAPALSKASELLHELGAPLAELEALSIYCATTMKKEKQRLKPYADAAAHRLVRLEGCISGFDIDLRNYDAATEEKCALIESMGLHPSALTQFQEERAVNREVLIKSHSELRIEHKALEDFMESGRLELLPPGFDPHADRTARGPE